MKTPDFDFDFGASEGVTHPAVPSLGDQEVAEFKSPPAPPTLRELVVEQIVRDFRTLMDDDRYHEPSREFYVERIKAYKETLASL